CVFCNQVETAAHMIIACPRKQDIWPPMPHFYLSNSARFSLHRVFTDLGNLTLIPYLFRPTVSSITIFDFFSVIPYQVWWAHLSHHFGAVPFIP
ncbi:hypothetical protein BD408DRAFT_347107, partial [Parasitella parasitica]